MSNNYVRDTLADVLRHTHSLGIYEMVKISGTDQETAIETVDPEKTVIFKAKTHNPVADFVDSTVGLSRMSVLDGYIKYPGFADETAMVEVVRQDRNGDSVPTEVAFTADDGTTASYRFMLADVVEQHVKSIQFKGATADVSIVPTQKNLKDLQFFNGVLGQFESTFSPRTEDGKLYFYIGDNGGDRTKILIAEGVDGDLKHDMKWPLDIVLKILRLGDKNTVLEFNAKGLLKITITSEVGEYTYLLPARG